MSTVFKPSVLLKEENGFINYLEWKRAWEIHFPGYGTAGKEVMEDREIRSLEWRPVVGPTMPEEQMVNGVLQIVNRPMTNDEKKQVPTKLTAWSVAQEKYDKSKGQLLSAMLESIEQSLHMYVENQPAYDGIIRQNNTRDLWKLIKTVVSNKGGSQLELIMKWRNLTQGDLPLSVHINQFEKLYANIDTTANQITPRQKAEQLVKSVDLEFFSPIIGHTIIMVEQPAPLGMPDPFPEYNVIKDQLIRFETHKNKLKPTVADTSTSSTAMYANSQTNVTCFKCLQPGHFSRDCKNQAKCSICGGSHHSNRHNDQLTKSHRNDNAPRLTFRPRSDEQRDTPKRFKLVKMIPKSSSSSSSSSSMSRIGVVSDGKKGFKKPFDPKNRDHKPKQVKKVFYMQEIEDNDLHQSNDEDESEDEYEEYVMDDSDQMYQDD